MHVSPAFRVEIGDTVTVGGWRSDSCRINLMLFRRSMPAIIQDGALQRVEGEQEQGGCKGIQQVLG